MRLQVAYSDKLVVPATYMRRFLGRTAQLSWVLPVIVYWFVARTILGFLLSAMGIDLTDQTIEFDILILEEILPMDQNEWDPVGRPHRCNGGPAHCNVYHNIGSGGRL